MSDSNTKEEKKRELDEEGYRSLREDRRYDEAKKLIIDSYREIEKLYGESDSYSVESLIRVGDLLISISDVDGAIECYKMAYENFFHSRTKADPLVLIALEKWANWLSVRDHVDEALKMHQRLFEERRDLLGDLDEATIRAIALVAEDYSYLECWDKAIELKKEVLKRIVKALGSRATETKKEIRFFSYAISHLKDKDRAVEIVGGLIAELSSYLERGNPCLIEITQIYAHLLIDSGYKREGMEMLRRAAEEGREDDSLPSVLSEAEWVLLSEERNFREGALDKISERILKTFDPDDTEDSIMVENILDLYRKRGFALEGTDLIVSLVGKFQRSKSTSVGLGDWGLREKRYEFFQSLYEDPRAYPSPLEEAAESAEESDETISIYRKLIDGLDKIRKEDELEAVEVLLKARDEGACFLDRLHPLMRATNELLAIAATLGHLHINGLEIMYSLVSGLIDERGIDDPTARRANYIFKVLSNFYELSKDPF